MIHFILGILATLIFYKLNSYSKRKGIKLNFWKNTITICCILYAVFVAEVIIGFIHEREIKAATVMGATTGIFAIIWAILLWKYIYSRQIKSSN